MPHNVIPLNEAGAECIRKWERENRREFLREGIAQLSTEHILFDVPPPAPTPVDWLARWFPRKD